MSDNEKITLIRVAGKLTQNGVHMATLENVEVKKMMKQIAANAALIILCDVNRTIVSNICDGDLTQYKDIRKNYLISYLHV